MLSLDDRPALLRSHPGTGAGDASPAPVRAARGRRRAAAAEEPLLRSADAFAVALAVLPVSLVLLLASVAPW